MAGVLLLLVAALILATDARALPYTLAPGSLTHLAVRVTATDGLTTETAIDVEPAAIDYGGASSEAFVLAQDLQGRYLFVENLDVFYGPMTFAGTVAAGAIPVSITFSSVDLSYTSSLGGLNLHGAALGQPAQLLADALFGSLAGSLSAEGVEVPFAFQSQDFCSGECWGSPNPNDPYAVFVTPLDDFDRFIIGGAYLLTPLVLGATIAEVRGITYRLEVSSSAHGSVLQVVPEPGSAGLIALGLATLAARRVRPRA